MDARNIARRPKTFFRSVELIVVTIMALVMSGCATVSKDGYVETDPYEDYNRAVYSFNDGLDKAILQPIANGYNAIVPEPVNKGVTNFFNNLADVTSAINNLLQLKIGRAANDVGRVLINSTIGILGLIDVASNMDLPSYKEDFGQTLGTWGADPGAYIVLPFIGPSSGRGTIGVVVDWFTNPVSHIEEDSTRWQLTGLDVVDTRADLMNASKVLDQAALDPYVFIREAYMQKRRSAVHDGNPPEVEDPFE